MLVWEIYTQLRKTMVMVHDVRAEKDLTILLLSVHKGYWFWERKGSLPLALDHPEQVLGAKSEMNWGFFLSRTLSVQKGDSLTFWLVVSKYLLNISTWMLFSGSSNTTDLRPNSWLPLYSSQKIIYYLPSPLSLLFTNPQATSVTPPLFLLSTAAWKNISE